MHCNDAGGNGLRPLLKMGVGFLQTAALRGEMFVQSFTSDQAETRAFSKSDHSVRNRDSYLPLSFSDYEKYSVRAGLFNYFFGIHIWLNKSWKCSYGSYINDSGI